MFMSPLLLCSSVMQRHNTWAFQVDPCENLQLNEACCILIPKNRIHFEHMKNVASSHHLSNTIIKFYGCQNIYGFDIFRDGHTHHIHHRMINLRCEVSCFTLDNMPLKILIIQFYTDINMWVSCLHWNMSLSYFCFCFRLVFEKVTMLTHRSLS